ncbi:MAG: Mor transcription activator family [Lachnospiraceae bacterium]|jgi:Mor family transcriptional regulator|nr:Mor transcription activator family [Lachnospiraceae bacterium]
MQNFIAVVFASSKLKIRGAENMKYIKAQNVLPEELIKLIQKYVDGDYLYIPRKDGEQKAWGEKSGTKSYLKSRNIEIYSKYRGGQTPVELSMEYFLSEQSIRRIISQEKFDIQV